MSFPKLAPWRLWCFAGLHSRNKNHEGYQCIWWKNLHSLQKASLGKSSDLRSWKRTLSTLHHFQCGSISFFKTSNIMIYQISLMLSWNFTTVLMELRSRLNFELPCHFLTTLNCTFEAFSNVCFHNVLDISGREFLFITVWCTVFLYLIEIILIFLIKESLEPISLHINYVLFAECTFRLRWFS